MRAEKRVRMIYGMRLGLAKWLSKIELCWKDLWWRGYHPLTTGGSTYVFISVACSNSGEGIPMGVGCDGVVGGPRYESRAERIGTRDDNRLEGYPSTSSTPFIVKVGTSYKYAEIVRFV